jgi:hypothetical protein
MCAFTSIANEKSINTVADENGSARWKKDKKVSLFFILHKIEQLTDMQRQQTGFLIY